jgi:hypothetical protein
MTTDGTNMYACFLGRCAWTVVVPLRFTRDALPHFLRHLDPPLRRERYDERTGALDSDIRPITQPQTLQGPAEYSTVPVPSIPKLYSRMTSSNLLWALSSSFQQIELKDQLPEHIRVRYNSTLN